MAKEYRHTYVKNKNNPTKPVPISHHKLAPGEWMHHGERVCRKVLPKPTLSQLDGEKDQ